MKKHVSSSANLEENDWKKVLVEVILKILTLGFYHIQKHKNR